MALHRLKFDIYPSSTAVAFWLSAMFHLCLLGTAGLILLSSPKLNAHVEEISVALVEKVDLQKSKPLSEITVAVAGGSGPKAPKRESATASTTQPIPMKRWGSAPVTSRSVVSRVGGLFGNGKGGSLMNRTGTVGDGANFFGISSSGNRFVFVVDSSRSMLGPRWEAAVNELLTTVEKLGYKREFYVFFFDVQSHKMFGPRQLVETISGSRENFERLVRWIQTVQHGPDTKPMGALRQALAMKPDAIYLLTDGEFRDRTAMFLRRNNDLTQDGVVIHTIGLDSKKGQRVLRRIASDNGGQYRFVPIQQKVAVD